MKEIIALSLLLCSLGVCEDSKQQQKKPSNIEELDDTTKLKAGDRISLQIIEDAEKSYTPVLQENGMIQCPYVGPLKAEGLTARGLALAVKKELEKTYFKKATVLVSPALPIGQCGLPPMGPGYTVLGQVGRQGRYDLKPDKGLTVSDALVTAGGFGFRPPKKLKLIRKTVAGTKTFELDLNAITRKGDANKDLVIQDGDVIVVPE